MAEFNVHYQRLLPLDYEIFIPEDDPVRLPVLERFDYTRLYKANSSMGRKPAVAQRIMF